MVIWNVFAADYERESGQISVPVIAEKNGIKIAVIGSGPAGLAFAGDMAKYGYDVTVFEALHEIGGVLKYGIPEFRLPNKIVDVEIDNLSKMGVNFIKDCIVGKTIGVEDLKAEDFKGIFVASGAGLPNFMNIPGENSINIMSSNEYLTRVNLMDAASEDSDTPVAFGKNVAVIGGGNTAMDSVRTAKRLGAERAIIIYRRSEEEMPARIEEVKHAKEEGVEFLTLHNPIEYIADEQGCVKQVILQKMELGEPDASGRRSPVAIPGATETIDIDLAIVSVGVSPNPIVPSSIKGLELGRKGTITVDDNMESSIPMIYAGGDIVRGGATVILAMGDGRKAAAAMNEQLKQTPVTNCRLLTGGLKPTHTWAEHHSSPGHKNKIRKAPSTKCKRGFSYFKYQRYFLLYHFVRRRIGEDYSRFKRLWLPQNPSMHRT